MPRVKHVVNTAGEHYGYRFHCPGCDDEHVLPTKPHPQGWEFQGSEDAPTFSPSILCYETRVSPRCHSFVRGVVSSF